MKDDEFWNSDLADFLKEVNFLKDISIKNIDLVNSTNSNLAKQTSYKMGGDSPNNWNIPSICAIVVTNFVQETKNHVFLVIKKSQLKDIDKITLSVSMVNRKQNEFLKSTKKRCDH